MKKLSNDEVKRVELDILSYVDRFCREHNLNIL